MRDWKKIIPVNRLVIALGGNHFRGKIVGRTAKGPSDIGHLLGKTEISNFQVAMTV
jgi:hypothetical protein